MNKILKLFALCAIISAALLSTSCVEQMRMDEITEMNLRRCLEPLNLTAKITDGDKVTFSWDATKGADIYTIEIATDSGFKSIVKTNELTEADIPYTIKLEADASYFFRVQAKATKVSKDPSKWAIYSKEIKTYAVKSALFLKVSDRSQTTLSFTWNADPEVDRLEYVVLGSEEIKTKTLSAEEIAAGAATIEGLAASTDYVVTLYFKSASRGEVNIWTRPEIGSAREVSNAADFKAALAAKEPKILLKAADAAYDLAGSVDILAAVEIYGEESVDGIRPIICGEFNIPETFEGGKIYFESIEMNGLKNTYGFAMQLKNGGKAANLPIEAIIYKNCNLTGYSKGLIYEWGQTMVLDELLYDNCIISAINEDGSGGGDVIDLRGASTVKSLKIVNSTIYNGFRTFVRLDATVKADEVLLDHNTLMNLCFVENTNNSGLLGIKVEAQPAKLAFTNNLVLYMTGSSSIVNTNEKNSADITIASNYYYSCVDSFFARTTQAAALAGGGKILSADPCFNSKGGVFNLVDAEAAAAKVGAPVWWTPYVEEPEDLTMPLISEAHTWNFSDAKYFVGDITKSKVRDGLFMGVTNNPLAVSDGSMIFPKATVVNRKGVPTDAYLAFKVDRPGSVYLKPVDVTDDNGNPMSGNHIIVSVGDLAGNTNRIKGGAAMNVDMTTTQKILISDITEESLVYIYSSGTMGLAGLAWSFDTKQVNTALDAPAPELAPESVKKGSDSPITMIWGEVENAASYSVVFNGKTYLVEGSGLINSYTITSDVVKFLDAGGYKIDVYANPGPEDIYNTQSSAGTAILTVLPDASEEGGDFVVSSVEDLKNAISSGKTAITLAESTTPYELGTLELTTPLYLKGQNKKVLIKGGNFSISGDLGGSLILEDLYFDGTGAAGSFIVEPTAVSADSIAVINCNIENYSKALYDNSKKNASVVQYLIIDNTMVDNSSAGSDFIDMRNGVYRNVIIRNCTFSNSARTFIRTDAGSEINYLTVRNNTFYKVATNSSSKDNNGYFHVRGTAGSGMQDFRIENNLFYSIKITEEPSNANGYPKFISKNSAAIKPNVISNNYFYNIEEEKEAYSWWTANCSREEGLSGGGVVLSADPCADAENRIFTLINAVAMAANVGAANWNPMSGGSASSEITVSTTTDMLTAISAGKKVITLEAGSYDLTTVADVAEVSGGVLTLATPLSLIGKGSVDFYGGFKLIGDKVSSFALKGINFIGKSGDTKIGNMIEIADADVMMNNISLKNSTVRSYSNRIFSMSAAANVTAVEFSGLVVSDMGTSGDFIDVRKGFLTALRVANNTFYNGIRTFVRIDASVISESAYIGNNTFYNLCSVDSKDNNGILHVRASTIEPEAFIVEKNIFAAMHRAVETPSQANGYPKLISSNSASKVPVFRANLFYDVDLGESYNWWNNRVTQEEATVGGGALLTETPFAASPDAGDFTVLPAYKGIGDPRW